MPMARSFYFSKLWQGILQRIGVLETQQGTIPPAEDYNTVADVRAETEHSGGDRIFCLENQIIYIFDDTSLASDNGSTVLKPNDINSEDPGRWIMEQQLALKGHTHSDKADKIVSPLQTRLLMANSDGNPIESIYPPSSFAQASHTHSGYATTDDLSDLQAEVDANTAAIEDKMDKYAVQAGDIGRPAVFNAQGNVIPGTVTRFYQFITGALSAGVTKSVSHNQDLATGYIINVRTADNQNNAMVQMLMPTPMDENNSVDIRSAVDIPAPGLIIQILGT
jgi:hypothetical protein